MAEKIKLDGTIKFLDKYNSPKYGDDYLLSLYQKIMAYMGDEDVDLGTNSETGLVYTQDVWGQMHNKGIYPDPNDFESIGMILAALDNKTLDIEHPILDSQMPYDNSRIHITIPDNTTLPTINIRRHHTALTDINALQKTGMFTEKQKKIMIQAVKDRKNIIISGETGSGKTTLLSALLNCASKNEIFVIIEDTKEIACNNQFVIRSITGSNVSGSDAVESSLRQNPKRIIYGEVRNETAYDLVDSWNTAHNGGMGTIHANSCDDIKNRLLLLCPKERDPKIFKDGIDEALDIGIQIKIEELPDGSTKRRIVEIKDFKEEAKRVKNSRQSKSRT